MDILGCEGRGRPADGPFDHSTGKGWVKERKGDYHDALFNRRSKVIAFIVEAFGVIAPQSLAALHKLARRAKTKGSRDRTAYGTARISKGPFLTHHTQRIAQERRHVRRAQYH